MDYLYNSIELFTIFSSYDSHSKYQFMFPIMKKIHFASKVVKEKWVMK